MISRLFHPRQHDDDLVVDHGEIGSLTRQVAQFAQIRHGLCGEIAAAREGGAHREAARPDMPFRPGAVELREATLFQGRQQAIRGRGRQPCANRKVAQAIAFIVLGERFDDLERAIDGLDAAIPRPDIVLRSRLGQSCGGSYFAS
jgi:hypothetical protein